MCHRDVACMNRVKRPAIESYAFQAFHRFIFKSRSRAHLIRLVLAMKSLSSSSARAIALTNSLTPCRVAEEMA